MKQSSNCGGCGGLDGTSGSQIVPAAAFLTSARNILTLTTE